MLIPIRSSSPRSPNPSSTMRTTFLGILLLAFALTAVNARCAPRVVTIQYKAASPRMLNVHTVCAGARCGAPVLTLNSACTEVACLDGSRCNSCTASLRAADLPPDGTSKITYGVYFDDEPHSFYSFTADWPSRGVWHALNGWILGCKNTPRVGCTNRSGCIGKKSCNCLVNDVALSLQGCYQTYFRKLNAENIRACIDNDPFNGFMPGEGPGVDGPVNICKKEKLS